MEAYKGRPNNSDVARSVRIALDRRVGKLAGRLKVTPTRAREIDKSSDAPAPGSDKLGTVIARRIEAEVFRGGWRVGQSLGSETELMERFKVSRAILREAIRQLEVHGAVKMVRGVGGGLVVSQAPHEAAERALAVYLELLNADVDELFEARKILEPLGARLAAERADDEGIRILRSLSSRLGSTFPQLDVVVPLHFEIRSRIGEIARNPALAIFISALSRYTVEVIAQELAANYPKRGVSDSTAYKQRVVDAIVGHDPSEAEAAMREDLESRHGILRRHFKARAAREIADTPSITASARTGIHPKLNQVVAMTIAHEIGRRNLQPGYGLGKEPDLLVRYGVSRAVFREAIRILELHGFVRTRRGHAGGLLVSEPNPSYALASATEFLRASKMNRDLFTEIRETLAVNVARLAAKRITAEGKMQLESALAANLAAVGAAVVSTARLFHQRIGELSGNRALSLFNRVVLELNRGSVDSPMPDDTVAALKRNNVRLSDAICAGDEALARRRMTEHMQDVAQWTAMGPATLR